VIFLNLALSNGGANRCGLESGDETNALRGQMNRQDAGNCRDIPVE
jgi:hypothetical protein